MLRQESRELKERVRSLFAIRQSALSICEDNKTSQITLQQFDDVSHSSAVSIQTLALIITPHGSALDSNFSIEFQHNFFNKQIFIETFSSVND